MISVKTNQALKVLENVFNIMETKSKTGDGVAMEDFNGVIIQAIKKTAIDMEVKESTIRDSITRKSDIPEISEARDMIKDACLNVKGDHNQDDFLKKLLDTANGKDDPVSIKKEYLNIFR